VPGMVAASWLAASAVQLCLLQATGGSPSQTELRRSAEVVEDMSTQMCTISDDFERAKWTCGPSSHCHFKFCPCAWFAPPTGLSECITEAAAIHNARSRLYEAV